MRIGISSLYIEPGISFKISYKVFLLIKKSLGFESLNFPDPKGTKDVWMHLIVGTKRECQDVEAKGPHYDKKNKCITWGLWLPYTAITQSENEVDAFIVSLFEAIKMVFLTYDFRLDDIDRIRDEIRSEIIGNNYYSYVE